MGIVCLALLTSLFEPIPCWGHLEILPPVGITEKLGFTVSNMRKYIILRKDANCSEWFSPEPWKEVIEYKRADRKKKNRSDNYRNEPKFSKDLCNLANKERGSGPYSKEDSRGLK